MAETDKKIDKETGIETTGHTWDGIEELNNPLPRWWLWIFYATVAWSLLYVIAYPAIPLLDRATGGLFGWSTRGEVAQDIADFEASNAELRQSLLNVDLRVLEENEELHRYAVQAGAAVYRNNCSQCHGSGGAGAVGYPNLLDDAWLWGGLREDIAYTVRHGIRNEEDPDARYSEMPAFGEILTDEEIDQLVQYVLAMSGQDHDATAAAQAEELFLDNCSACHGEDGLGMRDVGAPNLTDAIWLYGGDPETLRETLLYSRYGVMPPWGERLGEANVRAVAAYVHQLGGGEDAPNDEE
jgi:cytochrome c oxidase cbb3-type subunit 3